MSEEVAAFAVLGGVDLGTLCRKCGGELHYIVEGQYGMLGDCDECGCGRYTILTVLKEANVRKRLYGSYRYSPHDAWLQYANDETRAWWLRRNERT